MRNSVIKKNHKIYIFKHQQTSSGGGGGGADLENNKQVSITENGTVEIIPSAGKDGMKKVTATVNVTQAGEVTLYAWQHSSMRDICCYTYNENPSVGDTVVGCAFGDVEANIFSVENGVAEVSENQIIINNSELYEGTYTRNNTRDVVLQSEG